MAKRNIFMHIVKSTTLLLAITILHVQAEEAPNLRFCGTHWPPFTYSENGKITKGISFDIHTEAFKRLNFRFEAHDIPWARCIVNVETGKYDGVFDNNVKSPFFINGTNPTGIYPVAIYVRSDFPGTQLIWDELRGKKLGLVRGYEYPEAIKLNKAGFVVDDSINDAAMIRKLKIKRYDYMVSDAFSVLPLTKQEGIEVRMLRPLLGTDKLYLTFNKDRSELMHQFDDVLGEMIKDGTVDAIYKKYLPYTYHETMTLFLENKSPDI